MFSHTSERLSSDPRKILSERARTLANYMGRWAKIWPDELRAAIIGASLDRGLTVKKACELALAGQLEAQVPALEGLEREEIARRLLRNAYEWVNTEKRSRQGSDTPAWIEGQGAAKAIETLGKKLVGIAAGEVAHIEKQKPGKRDLDRLRKAAQMLREAQALVRKEAPTRSRKARDASEGKTPGQDGSAEAGGTTLIASMRASERGERPRQDDRAGDSAGGEQDRDGQQDEGQSGGILEHAGDSRESERAELAAELGIGEANGNAG